MENTYGRELLTIGAFSGVNAIRVYNLDPDLNHDLCASIFNEVSYTRPFSVASGTLIFVICSCPSGICYGVSHHRLGH